MSEIKARLLEEDISVSLMSIYRLLKKNERTGSIVDLKRKPSTPRILRAEHLKFIDDALAEDDELTARRLRNMLEEKWPGLKVSITTIKRALKYDLGWIRTHARYCQLIRTANMQRQLEW